MNLKSNRKKKYFNFNFNLFFKFYFFLSIFFFLLLYFIFINSGYWINSKKEILNKIYFHGLNNYTKIIEIAYKGFKGRLNKFQDLNLNISFDNIITLENDREKLILESKKGVRAKTHEFQIAKGTLTNNKKDIKINIRLKGDRITHFKDRKHSSYRLEIKEDEYFLGMKKFSLIKPRARNYIHEWLYHSLSSKVGLINLNYQFFNLKINGENNGLYVLEEGFGKELIERNKRRDGPIFSLMEEYSTDVFNSRFEVYEKKNWLNDENIRITNTARKKLELFISRKLEIENVFDLKKWAKFFAITDLTYTYHGLVPQNVKFYYNVVDGLFEPIPYDGHRFSRNYNSSLINFDEKISYEIASSCTSHTCESGLGKWLYLFFYDLKGELNNKFYSIYIDELAQISEENFIDNFLKDNKKIIEKINSNIYSDYFLIDNVTYSKYGPGLYFFSKDDFIYRSKVLREKIKKNINKITILEDEDNIIFLNELEPNNNNLVINKFICEVSVNNENIQKEFNLKKNLFLDNGAKISKKTLGISNENCISVILLNLVDNILFEKKIEKIFNKDLFLDNKNFYKDFFNLNNKTLTLKDKNTIFYKDIYIPSGYVVKIYPGERITILNRAIIISESPWIVGGDGEKTIISGTLDNFGGGILIKNTNRKNLFNNTEFKFLSGAEDRINFHNNQEEKYLVIIKYKDKNMYESQNILLKENISNLYYNNEFILYGSLNLFNANVDLINCNFDKIASEDAINIIASDFNLENISFDEIYQDAIDVDFGNGKIIKSSFKNIGNDAIDFSGSKAKLNNIIFFNVQDKLISVGENSDIEANGIEADKSFIGLASKDGSKFTAKNIDFKNVKVPFSSYQKKKAYNYGYLNLENPIEINNFLKMTLKDKNSIIFLNSEKIKKSDKGIIDLIYNNPMQLIK